MMRISKTDYFSSPRRYEYKYLNEAQILDTINCSVLDTEDIEDLKNKKIILENISSDIFDLIFRAVDNLKQKPIIYISDDLIFKRIQKEKSKIITIFENPICFPNYIHYYLRFIDDFKINVFREILTVFEPKKIDFYNFNDNISIVKLKNKLKLKDIMFVIKQIDRLVEKEYNEHLFKETLMAKFFMAFHTISDIQIFISEKKQYKQILKLYALKDFPDEYKLYFDKLPKITNKSIKFWGFYPPPSYFFKNIKDFSLFRKIIENDNYNIDLIYFLNQNFHKFSNNILIEFIKYFNGWEQFLNIQYSMPNILDKKVQKKFRQIIKATPEFSENLTVRFIPVNYFEILDNLFPNFKWDETKIDLEILKNSSHITPESSIKFIKKNMKYCQNKMTMIMTNFHRLFYFKKLEDFIEIKAAVPEFGWFINKIIFKKFPEQFEINKNFYDIPRLSKDNLCVINYIINKFFSRGKKHFNLFL